MLLASLGNIEHDLRAVQIVVAVDGPDPALEHVARTAGATVVVLEQNRGSYAARNAALDAVGAEAEVVLFTDADCVVDPAWITAHLRTLASVDASGGAVVFTMGSPPTPAEWVDAHRHLRQEHFVTRLGFSATCNLAVRRRVVDELRFDDSLRSGGDFDFGSRLRGAGFSLSYTPDAVVRHAARVSSAAVLTKVRRLARGARLNQARGHRATARRDATRTSSLVAAHAAGLQLGLLWRMRVRALDAACSVVYARQVPSVIVPALRRRITGRVRP